MRAGEGNQSNWEFTCWHATVASKNVQVERGVDSLGEGDGLDEPLYLDQARTAK